MTLVTYGWVGKEACFKKTALHLKFSVATMTPCLIYTIFECGLKLFSC